MRNRYIDVPSVQAIEGAAVGIVVGPELMVELGECVGADDGLIVEG